MSIRPPKIYNVFQSNPKQIYTDSHYAITATGGFQIADNAYQIKIDPIHRVGKYDMTNAVQITLDSKKLNCKLGVFNTCSCKFDKDEIILSSCEFLQNISCNQIISVGGFDTMYQNYRKYVNTFFGHNSADSTLFTTQSQTDMNGGIFDSDSFIEIVNSKCINSCGELVSAMSGKIRIFDINNTLKKSTQLNIFGNRYSELDFKKGFLPGDLIYISHGLEITLNLDLNYEKSIVTLLKNNIPDTNNHCPLFDLTKKYSAPILLRLV